MSTHAPINGIRISRKSSTPSLALTTYLLTVFSASHAPLLPALPCSLLLLSACCVDWDSDRRPDANHKGHRTGRQVGRPEGDSVHGYKGHRQRLLWCRIRRQAAQRTQGGGEYRHQEGPPGQEIQGPSRPRVPLQAPRTPHQPRSSASQLTAPRRTANFKLCVLYPTLTSSNSGLSSIPTARRRVLDSAVERLKHRQS